MEMSALHSAFEQAVIDSKSLSERPDNQTLLKIYSLYKQATEGDCNIDPPANPFDFVNKAKYEAWQALSGTSQTRAMEEYVNMIQQLQKSI